MVSGHNWPIFLGFHGGKGAATVVGISLAMLPFLTIIVLAPTALVFAATRNIILASAFGFILLNALTIATGQSTGQIAFCLILIFLVTATHYANYRHHLEDALKQGNWKALLSIE